MDRRQFMALLGGATVASPCTVRAQQSAMPLVGFIRTTSPEDSANLVEAFRQGLRDAGYVEGRNVAIEYRYAYNRFEHLPALAADLVNRPVAVLVATGGTISARAAKAATTKIPVVFTTGDDPLKAGLVESLSRPGGNLTGVSVFAAPLGAKRLGLLREVVPTVSRIALLINPRNPDFEDEVRAVRAAARTFGVDILVLNASTEDDVDAAFAALVQQQAGAVMLGSDTFLRSQRRRLVALAARHRVPAVDPLREYPEVGGLMSYGASLLGIYRQAGAYAGRILKGDKPGDLPVQLPTTFELVINLKTAKALGLAIPPTVLAIADELIE